ncbi:MAG: DUF1294 domain-containing protein [Pseudomonadota bacterium]
MAFDILPAAFSPDPATLALVGAPLLLAASLLTYAAFAADKRRAVAGQRRIREGTLLWLALLGGWPGAKLAQRRLRHKTRKQPFGTLLNVMAAVNVAVIAVLAAAPQGERLVARMQETGEALSAAVAPPEPELEAEAETDPEAEPEPLPEVWSLQ